MFDIRFKQEPTEVIFKLRPSKKTSKALKPLNGITIAELKRAKTKFGEIGTAFSSGLVRSVQPLFHSDDRKTDKDTPELMLTVDQDLRRKYCGCNVVMTDSVADAEKICEILKKDSRVQYAHLAQERFIASSFDPLKNRQWGLPAVHFSEAQSTHGPFDSGNARVAIIDTGVDINHPDLDSSQITQLNFSPTHRVHDTDGHGTHITGIIAAVANNHVGITGITSPVEIQSIKALKPFNSSGYYQALRHVLENRVDVLNLSLEGFNRDLTESRLIKEIIDSGTIVIAAMGNQRSASPSFPAGYTNVISVGASTESDSHYRKSNRGRHIDVIAPGVRILSTVPTYETRAESTHYDASIGDGTSMATAYVSGTAILARQLHPELTLNDFRTALHTGADFVPGQNGFSRKLGHGRLNILRTLDLL